MKMWLANKLHDGKTNAGTVSLPEGCLGIMLLFTSKKAARAFWGDDVELSEMYFKRVTSK